MIPAAAGQFQETRGADRQAGLADAGAVGVGLQFLPLDFAAGLCAEGVADLPLPPDRLVPQEAVTQQTAISASFFSRSS